MNVDICNFERETECIYKEEKYSVRDNGAVLRHSRDGKRPRPTDNKWTFGSLNKKTGYLEIATVRVHRILAYSVRVSLLPTRNFRKSNRNIL